MLVLGVDNSKRVLVELGQVAVGGILIIKKGIGLNSISKLLAMAGDVKELIALAPKALPELKDVDAKESGELAEVAYAVVRDIVNAIAA